MMRLLGLRGAVEICLRSVGIWVDSKGLCIYVAGNPYDLLVLPGGLRLLASIFGSGPGASST